MEVSKPVQPKPRKWQFRPGSLFSGLIVGFFASLIPTAIIWALAPSPSGLPRRVRHGKTILKDAVLDAIKEGKLHKDSRNVELDDGQVPVAPEWWNNPNQLPYAAVPVVGRPSENEYVFYAVTDYLGYPTLRVTVTNAGTDTSVEEIGPFALEDR